MSSHHQSHQSHQYGVFPFMDSKGKAFMDSKGKTYPYNDVMDSMWSWGIPESNPQWYEKVVALMPVMDATLLSRNYSSLYFLRMDLFYHAIKLEVEDIVSRNAGGELTLSQYVGLWESWFHVSGYKASKSFYHVAVVSFMTVEQMLDDDCGTDA
jgi:hypothetical protein